MMGQIVMTSYNNKTYRIDEVNYGETPRSTFPIKNKDGTTTDKSYMDYYLEVSHSSWTLYYIMLGAQ